MLNLVKLKYSYEQTFQSLIKVRKVIFAQNNLTLCKNFTTGSKKMNKNRHYKLKYFNFRVLGEPIRWQFVLAGVPFEDERLDRENWETNGKPYVGWGKLPVLEIDRKIQLTQSLTICRYLASEFDQLPATNWEQTKANELADNLQDLRLLYRPFVIEVDPTKKSILAEEILKIHFPFYFPKIEAFIKENGKNGYAVGSKVSWIDLFLANLMQIWTEKHGDQILDGFPTIFAHMSKILAIPQIKEWNRTRPVTDK